MGHIPLPGCGLRSRADGRGREDGEDSRRDGPAVYFFHAAGVYLRSAPQRPPAVLCRCRQHHHPGRGQRLRGRGHSGLFGRRGGLGLPVHVGIDTLDALHLVVLGQVVEDEGELGLLQSLHGVFRGGGVLGEDVGDLLGGPAKVLGHVTDTVFDVQQIKAPPLDGDLRQ